jgi:hypothetical protein
VARITTAFGMWIACVVGFPTTGVADPTIGSDTKCLTVVGYLDRKDTPHAQEAYRAARQLMSDLDAASVAKGQSSLLAPLDKEHAEDAYILVLESCRDDPQQTLGQTASETYDGLRDLRDRPPSH